VVSSDVHSFLPGAQLLPDDGVRHAHAPRAPERSCRSRHTVQGGARAGFAGMRAAASAESEAKRARAEETRLVAQDARTVKVFYPVFPPDANAGDVLRWLQDR
jgi:hypothetical protein